MTAVNRREDFAVSVCCCRTFTPFTDRFVSAAIHTAFWTVLLSFVVPVSAARGQEELVESTEPTVESADLTTRKLQESADARDEQFPALPTLSADGNPVASDRSLSLATGRSGAK